MSIIVDTIKGAIGMAALPEVKQSVSNFFQAIIVHPTQSISNISQAACKHYENLIIEKITKIPKENLQKPPLSIIGPALEASKYYIEEEDIRDMFANLIASSIDSDYNDMIHHSFVEIIKQLSIHDAKLFKSLVENNFFSHPIVDFTISPKENHNHVVKALKGAYINDKFSDARLNAVSINNLSRLGLLSINREKFLLDKKLYERYYNSKQYKLGLEEIDTDPIKYEGVVPEIDEYMFDITPFGISFSYICIEKFEE